MLKGRTFSGRSPNLQRRGIFGCSLCQRGHHHLFFNKGEKEKLACKFCVKVLNTTFQKFQTQSASTVEYHIVCPFLRIGIPPPPLPQASVFLPSPPKTKGGGTHSPAGEGVGRSQFGQGEKAYYSVYSVGSKLVFCSVTF